MIELGTISVSDQQSIIEVRAKMYNLAVACKYTSYQATQITSVFSELVTNSLNKGNRVTVDTAINSAEGKLKLQLKFHLGAMRIETNRHLLVFDTIEEIVKNGNGIVLKVEKELNDITFYPSELFLSEAKYNLKTLTRNELLTQLKRANEEVNLALSSLTEAQTHMVQSEKMAALGQLTSSIAHEVNNPLGAIQASNSNIITAFDYILNNATSLYKDLSEEETILFNRLIEHSKNQNLDYTTKEQRFLKRKYRNELEETEIEAAGDIAELLIDLKVFDGFKQYELLLKKDNAIKVLDLAYHFTLVLFNNENIDLAVKRAAKTVFALKRYSHRDEKQVMIETDVLENVNTVLTIYDNKLKQINLEKYLSPVALTYAFQDELGQVWTNLIHNSLHAVGEKGTIKICVFEKDKHIHVSVEDSGYGIPKEIQEKIFTPFFTTKAQGEGSGLGLDIVLKIIKKHNGTITLQSEVGIGTKFTVVMPVLSEPLNQENE